MALLTHIEPDYLKSLLDRVEKLMLAIDATREKLLTDIEYDKATPELRVLLTKIDTQLFVAAGQLGLIRMYVNARK